MCVDQSFHGTNKLKRGTRGQQCHGKLKVKIDKHR